MKRPDLRPDPHTIDSAVPTVILFDIDGTLVLTGGAGGRAMTRAFAELFDVPDAFRGIHMSGRTDSWILAAAAQACGISPVELCRFPDVYLRHLVAELEQPVFAPAIESVRSRNGVMPGVRELLDALSVRSDAYLALLTGNYEATARVKLEHFGLWHYFRCGAFGDAAHDRNGLVPKALERVRECGGPAVDPRDAVVIGDTPLDVACAASWGARCLAVATGGYDARALREAGADAVFEDLSDTHAVLGAIWRKRLGVEPSLPA